MALCELLSCAGVFRGRWDTVFAVALDPVLCLVLRDEGLYQQHEKDRCGAVRGRLGEWVPEKNDGEHDAEQMPDRHHDRVRNWAVQLDDMEHDVLAARGANAQGKHV